MEQRPLREGEAIHQSRVHLIGRHFGRFARSNWSHWILHRILWPDSNPAHGMTMPCTTDAGTSSWRRWIAAGQRSGSDSLAAHKCPPEIWFCPSTSNSWSSREYSRFCNRDKKKTTIMICRINGNRADVKSSKMSSFFVEFMLRMEKELVIRWNLVDDRFSLFLDNRLLPERKEKIHGFLDHEC